MTAAEQVERTFHEEHGRVKAALISQFEDIDLAEGTLQDALVNALERWEGDGIPNNPGAWLTTVARRRAIDRVQRRRLSRVVWSPSIPQPHKASLIWTISKQKRPLLKRFSNNYRVPPSDNLLNSSLDFLPTNRNKKFSFAC